MRTSRSSAGARLPLAALLVLALASGCGTISLSEERRLGEQVSRQVESEVTLVRDPQIAGYVDRLGRRLVAAAGPQPLGYRFAVVSDPALNAFAVPGGYVYVNTGTLLAAADMSELAGVVAHEVGHVALRHVAKSYNRQRSTGVLYQLGTLALEIFLGGAAAAGGELVGGVAAQAYLTRYSREAEEEADRFAIAILPRAGIDPRGLVRFFEKLRAQGGSGGPGFLSSHPATADRIAETSAAISAARLPADLARDDAELAGVQRRIRALAGSSGLRLR
jgi:predicted Zn-dependent protease